MTRQKILQISSKWLEKILIDGNIKPFTSKPELPNDLRIVDIRKHFGLDQYYTTYDLFVVSESFDDLNEGVAIPFLEIVFSEKTKSAS